MTATPVITQYLNRWGNHSAITIKTSTVGAGTLFTARRFLWYFLGAVALDGVFSCNQVGHVRSDADDGAVVTYVAQARDQGDSGSPQSTQWQFTHAAIAWDSGLTFYVDTGGSDSNDGLSSGAPKQTVAAAITALQAAWSGTKRGRILVRKGQTHSFTGGSLWNSPSKQGLLGFGSWSTGTKPVVTLSSGGGDVIAGVGNWGNSAGQSLSVVLLDVEFDGPGGSVLVAYTENTNNASPDDMSCVLSGVTCRDHESLFRIDHAGVGFTEAEINAGAKDGCAIVDTDCPNLGDYGLYGSARYETLDGLSIPSPTDFGHSPIRKYDALLGFARDITISGHQVAAMRWHSADSATMFHSDYCHVGHACWNGPYLANLSDDEGAGNENANYFERIEFHGCRANTISSSGSAWTLGGVRADVVIRSSRVRNCHVYHDTVNANNDDIVRPIVQGMASHCSGVNSSNTLLLVIGSAVTPVLSGLRFEGNFIYATSTGAVSAYFVVCSNALATSTIAASNKNGVIVNSNLTLTWFRTWTGGDQSRADWSTASGFDANSFAGNDSTFTHGFGTLGTAGTADDYDLAIGTSSSARGVGGSIPGLEVGYDGLLYVDDISSNEFGGAAPSAPSLGGASAILPPIQNPGQGSYAIGAAGLGGVIQQA